MKVKQLDWHQKVYSQWLLVKKMNTVCKIDYLILQRNTININNAKETL
jgi:hypothetical protein